MLQTNKASNDAAIPNAADLIAAAHDMISRLRERALECDRTGRIPDATIQDLIDARLFEITKPRRYGGYEMGWDVFGDVVMEIGAGCGSTGWVFSVLGQHPLLANRIGIDLMDEIWNDNPDALIAASKHLSGSFRKVEGGYVGSGVSTFASGCLHSDWVLVGGAPVEDSDEVLGPMLPIGDVEIMDTWHSIGLNGTGSHHVKYDEIFVPDHRARSPGKPPSGGIIDSPLYRTTGLGVPFGLSTVLVGIATGALEIFTDSMKARQSRAGVNIAEIQSLQMRIGESAAEIDAARSLIRSHLTQLMATLENAPPATGAGGFEHGSWPDAAGAGFDEAGHWPKRGTGDDSPHIALANSFSAQLAHSAIERLSYAAGARDLSMEEPLLRCLRDSTAGTRQYGINWDIARTRAGRSFLGLS